MNTDSTKPSLLMLTSSFPSGPEDETCGYIRELARSLTARFCVTVLCPPDSHAVEFRDDGFTLIRSRSPLPRSLDPVLASADLNNLFRRGPVAWLAAGVSLLSFALQAFRLALKTQIICSHWLVPSGFIGAAISRLLGRPHLVIEHSGALHALMRASLGAWLTRFIVAGSGRVVTVSGDLKRKLGTFCYEATPKTDVMPMGALRFRTNHSITLMHGGGRFDPQIEPETTRRRRILFIGRLVPIKGVDVLIRAVSLLPALDVWIAGDGECRGQLEAMAGRLGVAARFWGRVDSRQRHRLLASCDVVVVPSAALSDGRTEGTPVVCLEAMAAGCPVIASRVGGLAELIVDGENGLLFNAGDCEMLAAKLRLLMGDELLAERLSAAGRLTADRYDWSNVGSYFAGALERLLRDNAGTCCDQTVELDRARA